MYIQPRIKDFDPYPAIAIVQYYVGLWRYNNFFETPSNVFIFSMIFFHHGLSLKRHKKPLLNEDLYFDSKAIKIPSLLITNSKGKADFVNFKNKPGLCPTNSFVRGSTVSIFQSYKSCSDQKLIKMLAHPYMPFAKCKEMGLVNGDKVPDDVIANCF